MGVMLARLGRYCDCFEQVQEYDIEISKIKRIHKLPRQPTANSEGLSEFDAKQPSLENMEKLKPQRAALNDKPKNRDSSLGNILDSSYDNNMMNISQPDDESLRPSKDKLLKHKLQRIRERRKERERAQEADGLGTSTGAKKDRAHILNVTQNKDLFMDKDEVEEFDGAYKFD